MIIANQEKYVIRVSGGWEQLNPVNDLIDIEVVFKSGKRFGATFITVDFIIDTMQKEEDSNQFNYGAYFHDTYPIIVRKISKNGLCEVIDHLISNNSLEGAFEAYEDLYSPRLARFVQDGANAHFGIYHTYFLMDGTVDMMVQTIFSREYNDCTTVEEVKIKLESLLSNGMGNMKSMHSQEEIEWWLESIFDQPILNYVESE